LDDLIVGAYQAELSGKTLIGKSYVVFGKANNSAIDLSQINSTAVGFTKHNIRFTYIGYII
jgi:hypothetical protein